MPHDLPPMGRPPVRRVRLALYFSDDEPFTATQLDGLRAVWTKNYPIVSELPPLPMDEDLVALQDSTWPVAFTVFESVETGKRIAFQNDRFSVEWEFLNDAESYPGYNYLHSEIQDRYAEFSARLLENGRSAPPRISRVEAFYINHLGEHDTLDFLGSNFPKQPEGQCIDTFNRHFHFGENTSASVSFSDHTEIGAQLRIRTEADVLDEEGDPWGVLNTCHDQVIKVFSMWTTPAMRNAWA